MTTYLNSVAVDYIWYSRLSMLHCISLHEYCLAPLGYICDLENNLSLCFIIHSVTGE